MRCLSIAYRKLEQLISFQVYRNKAANAQNSMQIQLWLYPNQHFVPKHGFIRKTNEDSVYFIKSIYVRGLIFNKTNRLSHLS